jgi:hypothetical protein
LEPFSEKLSGFELKNGYKMLYEASNLADKQWRAEGCLPLLSLTSLDAERGWDILNKIGIPNDSWFVTIHVREYLPHSPNHVKVRSAPNADMSSYIPAIEEIVRRGGYVIRIGDPLRQAFPKLDGFIDCSSLPERSDWLDVFLCSACKFFIGTSSGPLTLPPTFDVPVLYTNSCVMGASPPLGRSLVLPKLFYSQQKNRLLSFNEILSSPLGWSVQLPDPKLIKLQDNTAEEIKAGAIEMFELLGKDRATFDNRTELQSKFDDLRNSYGSHASTPIANSFIKKYEFLID